MVENNSNIMAQEETQKSASPPYISFLTFNNFVTWLQEEGIPLRLDRSFWDKKYSGSTGAQLMTGLRFLGLLRGDMPQPALHKLVESKGEEKDAVLIEILKKAYTAVDFDSLAKATPNMLTEWLQSYGIERDTLRKVESFFINACKSTDIPLSNALRRKARNKPGTPAVGRKKRTQRKQDKGDISKPLKQYPPQTEGQTSQVQLISGGNVTLTVNVDLFQLSTNDREFVLQLVDIMKKYDTKKESAKEDIPF